MPCCHDRIVVRRVKIAGDAFLVKEIPAACYGAKSQGRSGKAVTKYENAVELNATKARTKQMREAAE